MTKQEIEELKSVLEYDLEVCDDPETARLIRIELAALKRLAKLEEAVAFKGFDEVPEGTGLIDVKGRDGIVVEMDIQQVIYLGDALTSEFVGWRYPVDGQILEMRSMEFYRSGKMPNQNKCDHVVGVDWLQEEEILVSVSFGVKFGFYLNGDEPYTKFNFCPKCGADLKEVWKGIEEMVKNGNV